MGQLHRITFSQRLKLNQHARERETPETAQQVLIYCKISYRRSFLPQTFKIPTRSGLVLITGESCLLYRSVLLLLLLLLFVRWECLWRTRNRYFLRTPSRHDDERDSARARNFLEIRLKSILNLNERRKKNLRTFTSRWTNVEFNVSLVRICKHDGNIYLFLLP